jgi:hypothetical protein
MRELHAPILDLLKARSVTGAQTETLVQLLAFDLPAVKSDQVRQALCALHAQGKVTRDRRHGSSWQVAA